MFKAIQFVVRIPFALLMIIGMPMVGVITIVVVHNFEEWKEFMWEGYIKELILGL